jgi:hypothetical protein
MPKQITIEDVKKQVDDKIIYFLEHFVTVKFDKYGNEEKVANPMAIKSYFFEITQSDFSGEPVYSVGQMNYFYTMFVYMIEQINLHICPFAADVKDFCKMTCLSNEQLLKYKDQSSPEMNNIVEKLYDFCRDSNLTLAQNKIYNANITTFKAKSELDVVEKKAPNVNVQVQTKVPLEMINERLAIIRNYEKKAIETNEK